MPEPSRFSIPDTRLPFVNTEITQTRFQGGDALVTSIWGGTAGGAIFFWRPEQGYLGKRILPNEIPGAYMLKQGPDGNLYLGCGNGDLIRYRPENDTFDVLVTGELAGITWGGCITGQFAVWASNPGWVGVYDWKHESLVRVFRPFDPDEPPTRCGHSVAEAPDGRILVGMNIPGSRFLRLDLERMEVKTFTPEYPGRLAHHYDIHFLNDWEFVSTSGTSLVHYEYPSFKLLHEVAVAEETKRLRTAFCPATQSVLVNSFELNNLYEYSPETGELRLLEREWAGECFGSHGIWQGDTFCGVTIGGEAHHYSTRTGQTSSFPLDATGLLPAHALCVVPEVNTILGAPFINQRFWSIDLESGLGKDRGRAAPGGGQINQIVWDPVTRRFILSSYTTCSLTAYDPSREGSWPENPVLLATAGDHGQMRPMDLVHDGQYLWMATSPNYGTLGGALCRVDPSSGNIDTWRHIVKDQKVNSLLVDPARDRIYFATEIFGDCASAPPLAETSRLVSFCRKTLEILRSDVLEDRLPEVRVHGLLEDQSVLVEGRGQLWAWNPEDGRLTVLGEAPPEILATVSWEPESGMFMAAAGKILRLTRQGDLLALEMVLEEEGHFLQRVEGKLWYTCEGDVRWLEL